VAAGEEEGVYGGVYAFLAPVTEVGRIDILTEAAVLNFLLG
jgi:hypothetical protein